MIIPIIPIIFAQRVTGLDEDEEEAQMQVAWKASTRCLCNHCHYPPCSFLRPYLVSFWIANPSCPLQCPYSSCSFAPVLSLSLVRRALSLCPSSFSFPGLVVTYKWKYKEVFISAAAVEGASPASWWLRRAWKTTFLDSPDNAIRFFPKDILLGCFQCFCCFVVDFHDNSKWSSIKCKNQKKRYPWNREVSTFCLALLKVSHIRWIELKCFHLMLSDIKWAPL